MGVMRPATFWQCPKAMVLFAFIPPIIRPLECPFVGAKNRHMPHISWPSG